jgi:Glycosyl hydrolase family 26
MHRTIRRALAPLPILAVLAVGCSQDDVDKVVEATSERQPAARGEGGLGVFMGGGDVNEIREYEQWVGSKVTHVGAFLPGKTWDAFHQTSFLDQWAGTGYTLSLGVPILMTQEQGTLQQGASGAYDEHFRRLAQDLVSKGLERSILRVGWEFNGDWYPWAAEKDPAAFGEYFRRIVTTMRSVPGGDQLRFDWNPGLGPANVPDAAYPGDEYVDIIGMDIYDREFSPELADPVKRWEKMVNQPFGLAWQRDFAAAHGKTLSYPEWGVSERHEGGGQQDNPVFVRNMDEWIRSNNVEYANYFEFDAPDEKGSRLMDGQNPQAGSLFQQLF